MGKNLQAALEKHRSHPEPAAVVSIAPVAVAAAPPAKAPSRDGKVHIGGYLPKDFKRSLMMVRAATGEDVQTLLAKALNDLFRAHNVPVVENR